MPSRAKRVMLVASVHQELVREGVFREEALEKLNSQLFLVKNDKLLPWLAATGYKAWDHAMLHQTIENYIRGKVGNRYLTYSESKRICEALIDTAPQKLHYATRDEMVNDLIGLFYCESSKYCEVSAS